MGSNVQGFQRANTAPKTTTSSRIKERNVTDTGLAQTQCQVAGRGPDCCTGGCAPEAALTLPISTHSPGTHLPDELGDVHGGDVHGPVLGQRFREVLGLQHDVDHALLIPEGGIGEQVGRSGPQTVSGTKTDELKPQKQSRARRKTRGGGLAAHKLPVQYTSSGTAGEGAKDPGAEPQGLR